MQINDSLINTYQNYINYWTAKASFNDLREFVSTFITENKTDFGTSFDHSMIFVRDFESEIECVKNYCIRSKVIKMATETCELYCKAILVENGKNWGELKGLGHNLLDCYNALNEADKNLIESIPLDYIMNFSTFDALFLSPPVGCADNYKEEYPDEYPIPLTDYLNSFASGRILPNIKARYPGQTLVDFNEQFILALAKLLHSFSITKKIRENLKDKDFMYFWDFMSE